MSLHQRIVEMTPDWLVDSVPDAVTRPVGEYFYRRAIANPHRNTCRIDDHEWTILAPSEEYSSGTTCHEPPVTRALLEELTEDSVFWDVGGHIGYFSVLALKVGGVPPENIHVFEADEANSTMIERNVRDATGGTDVHIVNESVGDAGTEHLCLDEYAVDQGPPDVVKIDAGPSSGEKSSIETDILSGMRETISDHSPTIFVEIHLFMEDYEDNIATIQSILDGNGYDYDYCRDVDRNDGSWTAIDSLDELPTDAEHEYDHFMLRCR